ncbi:hypothetical protein COV04_04660 [Candidatus Uhrbacteria bacterium CG10_big_fil_rev_8_21_14_0_10_48_11]|uniref:PPM-type phosphatase domain-containing protein n=1 Tax=Candidatus Uhrbacteria bacterium CG10_big_fil_rev_8_21_14_0_10_48_11 TaxID=1975037 RepID=A0A2M8LDL2_9BACT|nr:MAG: hypothetical protein COV04_04660 [Candidatus Uhrbacteria bacterium CG10_big_fil_rev_8_21_14_0_10_48_11]
MATIRTRNFIKVTSTSALDTVAGRFMTADNRDAGGSFFVLLKIDDIEALAPWADSFASFVVASFEEVRQEANVTTEKALALTRQRITKKLRQLISETKTISSNDVHYCFGAIEGLTITLTSLGSIRAYLLHESVLSRGSKRYRWLEITATPLADRRRQKKSAEATAEQASSLITGTAGENDTLIVTTESVVDAVGLNRIEKLLSDNPVDGAQAVLERNLQKLPGRLSFGTLTVSLRPREYARPRKSESVTSSMQHLLHSQTETNSLLIPAKKALTKGLGTLLPQRNVNSQPSGSQRQPVSAQPSHTRLSDTQQPASTARAAGATVGELLGRGGRLIVAVVISPLRFIRFLGERPSGRRRLRQIVGEHLQTFVANRTQKIEALPRSSQRLFIATLLFAYLFTQTLVYLADRQVREEQITANNQIISAIQERLDKAETSIVFGNDDETAKLISEATGLLATFPQSNKSQRDQKQLLQQSVNDLRDHLEKMVTVDNPQTLADLSTSSFANASGVIASNGKVLVYQTATNSFGELTEQKGVTDLPVTSVNIGKVSHGKLDDNGSAMFLATTGEIATLSVAANTLTALPIDNPPLSTTDFALYNGRLYLLSVNDGQIYRYQKAAGSYGRRAPWINGNVPELASADSIAIDGNVYVLINGVGVQKFFNGSVDASWHAAKPLTASDTLTNLTTTATDKHLYALDAATKRIIVWDKETGQLVHQYSFPNADSILGYALDSQEKYLYVLTPDRLLETAFVE